MLYASHGGNGLYYDQAADPKQRATITALFSDENYVPCLRSFLGKYLIGS
jgi:hypothetical protein